jgi:hypothetical protein
LFYGRPLDIRWWIIFLVFFSALALGTWGFWVYYLTNTIDGSGTVGIDASEALF